MEYLRACDRIAELPANWDSYGAAPFEPQVIERARRIVADLLRIGVPEPLLIPAASESIILWWSTDDLHLEIDVDPDGDDSVLIEMKDGSYSADYDGPLSDLAGRGRKDLDMALACLVDGV